MMKNVINIIYFIIILNAIGIWSSVCLLSENNAKEDLDVFTDIEICDWVGSLTSDFIFDDEKMIINKYENCLLCGAYDVGIHLFVLGFESDCYLFKNVILFEADNSPPEVVA